MKAIILLSLYMALNGTVFSYFAYYHEGAVSPVKAKFLPAAFLSMFFYVPIFLLVIMWTILCRTFPLRRKEIKRGINKETYLIRRTLFDTAWFSIKLHRILLSDEGCLHDHPWSFISIILWGGYQEETINERKRYGIGSILRRKPEFAHKLHVDKPALTMVITFKKKRMWGFLTKEGWKPYWAYNLEDVC